MLNLKEVTEDFIRTKLTSFVRDTDPDVATVRAIAEKGMMREEREGQVLKWLRYYKVIRFFPPKNSGEIARRIVEFADEPRPECLLQNKAQIISEYRRLKERIQPLAPRTKSGKERRITSLTSKALWCCYPQDVPIFDDYAERSLQMIGRICRIFPDAEQDEYGRFVDVWLQIYREIEPFINEHEAYLKGFAYKIRLLDGILWYLGKPEFDVRPVG
jgi:hypothetical protein